MNVQLEGKLGVAGSAMREVKRQTRTPNLLLKRMCLRSLSPIPS